MASCFVSPLNGSGGLKADFDMPETWIGCLTTCSYLGVTDDDAMAGDVSTGVVVVIAFVIAVAAVGACSCGVLRADNVATIATGFARAIGGDGVVVAVTTGVSRSGVARMSSRGCGRFGMMGCCSS